MSESETDIEFVSDMEWLHSHDREAALPPEKLIRLFALARRGAETAAEIERLKAEVSALNHAEVKLLVQVDEQDAEIERLKAELLERDAVWLPEKDAEIERLQAALRDALSYSTIGDMPVTIYENARAALKEDGDE